MALHSASDQPRSPPCPFFVWFVLFFLMLRLDLFCRSRLVVGFKKNFRAFQPPSSHMTVVVLASPLLLGKRHRRIHGLGEGLLLSPKGTAGLLWPFGSGSFSNPSKTGGGDDDPKPTHTHMVGSAGRLKPFTVEERRKGRRHSSGAASLGGGGGEPLFCKNPLRPYKNFSRAFNPSPKHHDPLCTDRRRASWAARPCRAATTQTHILSFTGGVILGEGLVGCTLARFFTL